MNTIISKRLTLRLIEELDAPAVTALMTPEISRWLASWPAPLTLEMARDRIALLRAGAARGDIFPYAVERLGAFVGMVILARTPDCAAHGELGYWLGAPFQGQGFMTEAVVAVLHAALGGFTMIEAGAQPENAASFRVMRAAGMVYSHEAHVFAPSRQRDELCHFYGRGHKN
jgi:ribosomal-protein-alanine N-acetyltransferase